jgi:hypothetical protein
MRGLPSLKCLNLIRVGDAAREFTQLGQKPGRPVLVDHGLDAFKVAGSILDHRNTAAPSADDGCPIIHEDNRGFRSEASSVLHAVDSIFWKTSPPP